MSANEKGRPAANWSAKHQTKLIVKRIIATLPSSIQPIFFGNDTFLQPPGPPAS